MKTLPDLNELYKNGATNWRLHPLWKRKFKKLLHEENWAVDREGVYNSVPNWRNKAFGEIRSSSEEEITRELMKFVPRVWVTFLSDYLENSDEFASIRDFYELSIRMIDIWNGCENLDWHWDGPGKGSFILMFYDSSQIEEINDGGFIEWGVRDIDDELDKTKGKVTKKDYCLPKAGNVVLINNNNPRFVHRVEMLKNRMNRFTLTANIQTS